MTPAGALPPKEPESGKKKRKRKIESLKAMAENSTKQATPTASPSLFALLSSFGTR
jgi:hypothetical protein